MKKIVIMGATSGIGLELAQTLADGGIKVGVAGRKTAVLTRLKAAHPDNIEYETIDVTHGNATMLLRNLIDRIGGMDMYIHVSGVGYDNVSLEPDKELATLDVNVMGFSRMIGYVYRYFRDSNRGVGHIVAVTSVAGTNGIGNMAAYSSAKCFDQCYLRALNQLAISQKLKIKFTDIRPGWVRTPLLDDNSNYPMTMTTQYVVRQIIKSIRHNRRVSVIDWRWNLVVGLWRLIPNRLWLHFPMPTLPVSSGK